MYGKYKQEMLRQSKITRRLLNFSQIFLRAYLNRAFAYAFLKEHDKAIADYKKMVEIRPDELKRIIDSRAEQYYEKGDYAKAWTDVEKAKELGVNVDKEFIEKLQKASPRKQ